MTKRKSFLIHIDSLDILEDLTDEQAGQLLKAMKSFHTGEEISLSGLIKIAFNPFKNQFIRDNEKYQKICERNRSNGNKGGRPEKDNEKQGVKKETQDNPNNPIKPTGLFGNPRNPNKPDNKNDSDSDSKSKNKQTNADAIEVIEFLNELSGKSFRSDTKSNQSLVKSILKDGYTVEDCKLVCRYKNWEWKDDAEKAKYIQPSTLFQKSKFDGYLNAAKMELNKRDTAKTIQPQTPEQLAEIKLKREQEEAAQMRRDLGIE
jgi:uncharacterized phage protein (TIGR02220 family)